MTSSKLQKPLIGFVFFIGSLTVGSSDVFALGGWPLFHGNCNGNCDGGRFESARSCRSDNCCPKKCRLGSLFGWMKHNRCGRGQSECRSGCGGAFGLHRHRSCCGDNFTHRHHQHSAGCGCGHSGCSAAMLGGLGDGNAMPVPPVRRWIVKPRRRVVPPPGTLGWTYRKVSRSVPDSEHPRTGMLEICNLPQACSVTVDGMNGYRGTNGVWYFKTDQPLTPGVPHIVTARAQVMHEGVLTDDIRVVRLIRGRVVSLSY